MAAQLGLSTASPKAGPVARLVMEATKLNREANSVEIAYELAISHGLEPWQADNVLLKARQVTLREREPSRRRLRI